jgi:hypothetical protein
VRSSPHIPNGQHLFDLVIRGGYRWHRIGWRTRILARAVAIALGGAGGRAPDSPHRTAGISRVLGDGLRDDHRVEILLDSRRRLPGVVGSTISASLAVGRGE